MIGPLFLVGFMVLWIAGGIVLIGITSGWEPQPGKRLFLGFISLTCFAIPICQVAFSVAFQISAFNSGSAFLTYQWLSWLNEVALLFLVLMSQLLLILFATKRLSQNGLGSSDLNRKSGTFSEQELAEWQRHALFGFGWNTNLSSHQRVEVLRRREWAFLIDAAAAVLSIVGYVMVAAWLSNNQGMNYYTRSWISANETFALLFFLLFFAGMIYLIFKDAWNGVSVGKKYSGCRVVDLKTGLPLGVEQSVVRNLIYLIPFSSIVEIVVASVRDDRRRLGDLWAGTIVVQGEPDRSQDGSVNQQANEKMVVEGVSPQKKHPLDD